VSTRPSAEAWYARQTKEGVQVVICHPKLVETGLDLLDFPTIIFYESGYSLHTLRQASRRSWRIGQRRPVRVKFLCSEGTMQTSCLRLMRKKFLVALTMEGKFAGEGLQSIDADDDMLSAMAREPVERTGIGETADAVWRALNTERQKLFPTNSHSRDDASSIEMPGIPLETQPAQRVLFKAPWTEHLWSWPHHVNTGEDVTIALRGVVHPKAALARVRTSCGDPTSDMRYYVASPQER